MAIWNGASEGILRLFTDTVTVYHKRIETNTQDGIQVTTSIWDRNVVEGVQWSEQDTKEVSGSGIITVAHYISVTFPRGTYEGLQMDPRNEEDVIVYGVCEEEITEAKGHRVADILARYKAGRIKSVNDNSNRTRLKNIKVVIA